MFNNSFSSFNSLSGNAIDLIVKVIKKFLTDIQQFDSSYCRNDHFQKRQNDKIIPHYVQLIKNKYQKEKKPLSILDFCCGHGIPTLKIVQMLLQNDVKLQKVRGYDVSEQNLNFAIKNNPCQGLVEFKKKNLQTEFSQVEQYDVVVILFGLHWMNNVQSAIQNIYRSLKPGGIVLSLTPIGNRQLFDFRKNFIQTSRWKNEFDPKQFQLYEFHDSDQIYTKSFNKFFETTRNQVKTDFYQYSYDKMITFFESWFQEVRHIIFNQKSPVKRQVISKCYIAEFLYTIPEGFNGRYMKKNNNRFSYAHPLQFFEGRKNRR